MLRPLIACAALAPALLHAAPLTVELDGARPDGGPLVVLVFDRAEGFLQEARALRREILAEGATRVRIELPPGRYALLAYHDENGDGVLNHRVDLLPAEGRGLSRSPVVSGKPAFDDAAFELPDAPTTLAIKLAY